MDSVSLEDEQVIRFAGAYAPLFWWQDEERERPAKYLIFYGGRGGGKSWAVAASLVMLAAERPVRILCAREYQTSIAESAKALLEDMIIRLGYAEDFTVLKTEINSSAGAHITFAGLHTHPEETLKSKEGYDVVWCEEAQALSDKTLDVLGPTMRKPGSVIIMTLNPDHETDPVARRFILNPTDEMREQALVVRVTWEDMARAKLWTDEQEANRRLDEGRPEYAHIWDGDFISDGERQVISFALVAAAIERGRLVGI